MSTAFNAIPFLPQIRHVIDWTYTSTCFDLKQWIKFESIYNSIFGAYTEVDENDDAPIGKKMEIKKQKGIGNSLAFILVLISSNGVAPQYGQGFKFCITYLSSLYQRAFLFLHLSQYHTFNGA